MVCRRGVAAASGRDSPTHSAHNRKMSRIGHFLWLLAAGKIMRCRVKATNELVAVKVYERSRASCHMTRSGHRVLVRFVAHFRCASRPSLVPIDVQEDADIERRILKRLRAAPHPHLLPEHSSGAGLEMGARVDYAPMPYADGGDLLTYLREHDVTPAVAARHFVRIASAVRHLHSMGWAHRDVSLENVLLVTEDAGDVETVDAGVRPVLGDYGLAVELGPCPAPTSCRPGKPGYMSPEIYQFKPYDAASNDVYSLGVVLFGLLARALPYNAPSSNDVAFRMIQEGRLADLLDAWSLSSRFKGGAMELVSSMLHRDPAQRPSLDEVLAHRWCADAVAHCKCGSPAVPAATACAFMEDTIVSMAGSDAVVEDECKAVPAPAAELLVDDALTGLADDDLTGLAGSPDGEDVVDAVDLGDSCATTGVGLSNDDAADVEVDADVNVDDASDSDDSHLASPSEECDQCVCDGSLTHDELSTALAHVDSPAHDRHTKAARMSGDDGCGVVVVANKRHADHLPSIATSSCGQATQPEAQGDLVVTDAADGCGVSRQSSAALAPVDAA